MEALQHVGWSGAGAGVGAALGLLIGLLLSDLALGAIAVAVGVRAVRGNFRRGELVACVDGEGREIARGLVNYSADETRRIMGSASSEIERILGYAGDEELIHRDNLVIV